MSAHENGKYTRLPPHDRNMERALLGAILREPVIVEEVTGLVNSDDFYIFAHQLVYAAMLALADKGKPIDIEMIAVSLTRDKRMDDIGGHGYLAELWDAAPAASHWRHYSDVVRDHSTRRSLITASLTAGEAAYDLGEETMAIVGAADKAIAEIAERGILGETVEFHTALSEAYVRLDGRRQRNGEMSGVPTGFVELDTLLCGFQMGELIIVGARPSVGKTAFALNVVRHAAVNCQIPTMFVSLEQSRVELAERMLCMDGRVDSHKLRRGYLSAQDQSDLMDAGDRLGKSPLLIADAPLQTVAQISANVRRYKRKKGIQFVVLDYLQLIDPDDRRANRQEQVAASSRRLKALARDLKIPVVVVCAVNRGPEDRADKRPKLSDLRESGAIEFDADTVILLHRSEGTGSQDTIEVHVAKQRNGPIGEVRLVFQKPYMRFYDEATP